MTLNHLNLEKVMDCYGGSATVLKKTIGRIYESMPNDWALFLQLCDQAEYQQASIVAHRMAGTVSMVGADEFSKFLREVSRSAKTKEHIPSPILAQGLKYYEELMGEMGQFVTQFPSPADKK